MSDTQQPDRGQTALWNGPAARAWVDAQELLDDLFRPFERALVEAVSGKPASNVLDVGCGTGGTTVAMARALGEKARCTGVDVSEPMIAAAVARAERESLRVSFVCADAQTYAFQPGQYDMIVSRFGVMFFDDPVEAFSNLRRAGTGGAGLRFIAWRSAEENPFMTTAERAAAPLLPDLPARRPDEPGQFAFAERSRILSILQASGWAGIGIRPMDVVCTMPEAALMPYLTRFGPVGRAIQESDDETRARVMETVHAAFEPYVESNKVRFTAGCWMVEASGQR